MAQDSSSEGNQSEPRRVSPAMGEGSTDSGSQRYLGQNSDLKRREFGSRQVEGQPLVHQVREVSGLLADFLQTVAECGLLK
jgi:hypothetical protein